MNTKLLACGATLLLMGSWACGADVQTQGDGTSSTSSGGTSSGGAGGSTVGGTIGAGDLPEKYCKGDIARDEKCDNTPATLEACLADDDVQCIFSIVRPEVAEELISCLNARDCGESDDGCIYDVGAASPTKGQEAFGSDCAAKNGTCPSGISDDFCAFTLGSPELYQALSACLALPCGQVSDCFTASLPPACQ